MTCPDYIRIVRALDQRSVSPARPGAFAANFDPETLDSFRDHCKAEGRQYSKVLERMAEMYVLSNGEILEWEKTIRLLSEEVVTLKEKLAVAEKGQSKAGAVAERIEVGDGESLATDDFDEDLKEFYPPPELKDWKMGWAVTSAAVQEMMEKVSAIEQWMIVQGMTPKERPQDELSIDDEEA